VVPDNFSRRVMVLQRMQDPTKLQRTASAKVPRSTCAALPKLSIGPGTMGGAGPRRTLQRSELLPWTPSPGKW
jgi:hypothetical protein